MHRPCMIHTNTIQHINQFQLQEFHILTVLLCAYYIYYINTCTPVLHNEWSHVHFLLIDLSLWSILFILIFFILWVSSNLWLFGLWSWKALLYQTSPVTLSKNWTVWNLSYKWSSEIYLYLGHLYLIMNLTYWKCCKHKKFVTVH